MEKKESVKFSRAFWVANAVELLERAAYYGVFIVITLYLSRILGFNDMQAAVLAGSFSAGLYFLPTFAGAIADKIGFKQSLIIAFSLVLIYLFIAMRRIYQQRVFKTFKCDFFTQNLVVLISHIYFDWVHFYSTFQLKIHP